MISDRSPYDYILNKMETDVELDHKEYTTLKKLRTQIKLDFESQTTSHKNAEEIKAENELFTHAIKGEVESLKQNTSGLKDYLRRGKILNA
ncbi:MAG: hypothetical protein IPL23_10880 [Saprospiraceae bacterium]|nr:hypothetical protein [Saprospiraceae bacterium]